MVTGIDDNGATIQCGDGGAVRIETAMPDGAKRTSAYEWATEASVKQGTTCE
jgi:methionyl-tRNA formyltransferase